MLVTLGNNDKNSKYSAIRSMRLSLRRRICIAVVPAITLVATILTVSSGLWILVYEPNNYKTLPTTNPAHNGIFFIEGYGQPRLTARMWCAVESAAKHNPATNISVLMVAKKVRNNNSMMPKILSTYKNIQLLNLNVSAIFMDTPLNEWYQTQQWKRSYWPNSHFSDALRWLCLLHFGGTYMDMDIVVNQALPNFSNYLGLESHQWASAGVVRFTHGHPLALEFVEQLAKHFDPLDWGANGPKLITKVLQDKCGLELPSGNTPGCSDITVLPPKAFYPIPWWDWKLYVTENSSLSQILLQDKEVFALHVWNHHSYYSTIHLHSKQPYAIAAARSCPVTVAASGDTF